MNRAYKWAQMVLMMELYNLRTLVETGTYQGDTVGFFRHHMDMVYSIERDKYRYLESASRFKPDALYQNCNWANVNLIHGDSAVELPKLLGFLVRPTLFWLDAHGDTDPNDYSGPIIEELAAIFASPCKGVILVDDVKELPVTLPEHPNWQRTLVDNMTRYINVG